MKIIHVGLKGFQRSEREGGGWSWTPEVLLEYDPLAVELTDSQKESIELSLESCRSVLQGTVERFHKLGKATRLPEQKSLAPPEKGADMQKIPKLDDGYDEKNKRWNHCLCGNEDINHVSKTSGKAFQGCFDCGLFLNPDGKAKSMQEKGSA